MRGLDFDVFTKRSYQASSRYNNNHLHHFFKMFSVLIIHENKFETIFETLNDYQFYITSSAIWNTCIDIQIEVV